MPGGANAASMAVARASPSSSRTVARSSWASAASSSSSSASRSSSASTARRSSGVSGPQSTLCLPSRAAASTWGSPVVLAVATARSAIAAARTGSGAGAQASVLGERRLDLGGQGRVLRCPGQGVLQQAGHLGRVGARLHPDGVQPQRRPGQHLAQVVPRRLAGLGQVGSGSRNAWLAPAVSPERAQRLPQAGQHAPALRAELPGLRLAQRPPVVPGRVLVGRTAAASWAASSL